MDAVESRRRCGSHLALFGNIDAKKMSRPRDALEAELRRRVPLARAGGYIMHSHHSCPPEVSFDWVVSGAVRAFKASQLIVSGGSLARA